MANKGGQPGNTNAADGKLWRAAIRRALENRSKAAGKEALDELAEKFLSHCDEGQGWAFREFGDRMDGKATQPIEGTGENGGIDLNINVKFR